MARSVGKAQQHFLGGTKTALDRAVHITLPFLASMFAGKEHSLVREGQDSALRVPDVHAANDSRGAAASRQRRGGSAKTPPTCGGAGRGGARSGRGGGGGLRGPGGAGATPSRGAGEGGKGRNGSAPK